MFRAENRAHSCAAKASLTVEAATAFTLFFFTIYLFWQCFLLIFFELHVADGVVEATKEMSRVGYAERKLTGKDAEHLALLYLPALLQKVDSPDFVKWKVITCTSADDGSVNILVTYRFVCEAPMFSPISLPVHQAFKVYPFIGTCDSDGGNSEKKDDDDVVYITKNGTVYHENKSCTYLKMTVSAVTEDTVSMERNNDGGKYYECSECKDCNHTGLVYITNFGDRYHYSASCSAIYRDIIEIKRSEIGDRKACSKCGGIH